MTTKKTASPEQPTDGLLLVDKPGGRTSHDIVVAIRRLVGRRTRVGHAGTLNPLATGLLPIMLGRATRLLRFITSDPKIYVTTAELGLETTTGDIDGEPLAPRRAVDVDDGALEKAIASLSGPLELEPPMYSAKKIGGRRLYQLARAGVEVERAKVPMRIDRLTVSGRTATSVDLEVVCSPGTYVRSLVSELGHRLGVGATVGRLRRTGSGLLRVDSAALLADLRDSSALRSGLLPLDSIPLAVADLGVDDVQVERFATGRTITFEGILEAGPYAVRGAGRRLVGIGAATAAGSSTTIVPKVVLTPA